ncbi:MAG TPA: hypothetical protein VN751_02425 [Solirubrobacteraceae bacterium]|nr:hypothetical protein [Solirubrobacteraceae bacterium]
MRRAGSRTVLLGTLATAAALAPAAHARTCDATAIIASHHGAAPRLAGHRLRNGDRVPPGGLVTVRARARARLRIGAASVSARGARLAAACARRQGLLVLLDRGTVLVRGPATVLTRNARVRPAARPARFAVIRDARRRRTTARTAGAPLLVAATAPPRTTVSAALRGQSAVVDRGAQPRLDVWPFAPPAGLRRARRSDRLPAWDADGAACSVGCRPFVRRPAWPLRPFHAQHALRAGIDELRPSGFHVGIDIQAGERQRVFALQDGFAHVIARGTVDERVRVGDFLYWHVRHRVREGQRVVALRTVLGRLVHNARHLHLSELRGGRYLNPLRRGGRVLAPWGDTLAPVIARPRRTPTGFAVRVFDPQSFTARVGYLTPVLAPAAVAFRLDGGPLRFALRATHVLAHGLVGTIFAPDAHRPGWDCFAHRLVCRPDWDYRLLTLPIPFARRLTVYAWDWAGNASVLASALRGRAVLPA